MIARQTVLVTVGMGQWPFDRLLSSLAPLCAENRVFVQTGTSQVRPPCDHASYLPYPELMERIAEADVVITHAGNTVRIVQRMGKLPIAIARTARFGEMADDHQVSYLRREEGLGRALAVWDVDRLCAAVARHQSAEREYRMFSALSAPADPADVADRLDREWEHVRRNPYAHHALRRYAYAWDELARLEGPHLDIGCGRGDFAADLAETSGRQVSGVDAHAGYLAEAERNHPALRVRRTGQSDSLPWADGEFASVSMLDVLEHCSDEDHLLTEARRVLRPGGTLVLTVPARHMFSFLDPDDVKFRWPTVHRAVYRARFGREEYRRRFEDLSDGLRGDIAVARQRHTNYEVDDLLTRLAGHGFTVTRTSGANLLWRLVHGPALLAPRAIRRGLDQIIALDGRTFDRANLFVTATRGAS